jgi:hypothetical protein
VRASFLRLCIGLELHGRDLLFSTQLYFHRELSLVM